MSLFKRPKRMCDWVGAKVQTLHTMENGYARIPAGSTATVTGVSRGLYLTFDYCDCCRMGVKISRIRPEHLEIIALPEESAQSISKNQNTPSMIINEDHKT